MAKKFLSIFAAGILPVLSVLFWFQNGVSSVGAVDLDKMVFQLTYNVLLEASGNVPIGTAKVPLKTRLKVAMNHYRGKLVQEQDYFADAFFDAIMHLALVQQPLNDFVNIMFEDEMKKAADQLGPKKRGKAAAAEEAKTEEPLPAASRPLALALPSSRSPRTSKMGTSMKQKEAIEAADPATAAFGKNVWRMVLRDDYLSADESTSPLLVEEHEHVADEPAAEEHAADQRADEDEDEHWEIVEPSFAMDWPSLENFEKFYKYCKNDEKRVVKGHPYDIVEQLQDFSGNGRHVLRVMLLFYDLYRECSLNSADQINDPTSTCAWLAKVNDRIVQAFKLFSMVSLHSDVLNSQLLNLFRPFDGSGTGSPLTPRSPKVASPSGASSSLPRSRSQQFFMQSERSPTPMRSPPGRLGPASPNKPQAQLQRRHSQGTGGVGLMSAVDSERTAQPYMTPQRRRDQQEGKHQKRQTPTGPSGSAR